MLANFKNGGNGELYLDQVNFDEIRKKSQELKEKVMIQDLVQVTVSVAVSCISITTTYLENVIIDSIWTIIIVRGLYIPLRELVNSLILSYRPNKHNIHNHRTVVVH